MVITTATIIKACSFVVAVGGAGMYLNKIIAPLKSIGTKLDQDKKRLDEHQIQIEKLHNDNNEILKTLNVMLSHMVTNNNTGELKQRQQELTEHLINR